MTPKNSHGDKNERQQCKQPEKQRPELSGCELVCNDIVHGSDAKDGLIFVNILDGLAERSRECVGIQSGSDHVSHEGSGLLQVGHKQLGARFIFHRAIPRVRDDTDNLHPGFARRIKANMLP